MSSTEDILNHHLASFGGGDLDGIMTDYTDASVLFTQSGTLTGPAAIRELFAGMFAEFAKPGASFNMITQSIEGEVAFIVWSAETADNIYELATDTFVVRNGKIAYQTLAGKIVPRA